MGSGLGLGDPDSDELPQICADFALNYEADVIASAGSMPWGSGDLLLIDGVTTTPVDPARPARSIGWAIVASCVGLALGAVALRRRSRKVLFSGTAVPALPKAYTS